MSNFYWPFEIDHVVNYGYGMNIFNNEECDKIIQMGNNDNLENAKLSTKYDVSVRDSKTQFLPTNDDTEWIYRKLTDAVQSINEQCFKFELTGFGEGLQFTKYEAPTGKYDCHIDKTYNGKVRKLSISLQLSESYDYVGGDLEVYAGGESYILKRARGTLIFFPSYLLHRVTPVTEGTRYSLVAWVTGPNFR